MTPETAAEAIETICSLAKEVETESYPCPKWVTDLSHSYHEGRPYYVLLFAMAQELAPARILEIGTDKAVGTLALAHNPVNEVFTVDCDPACQVHVDSLPSTNVTFILGDSLKVADGIAAAHAPFDLLLIDAEHNCEAMYCEYHRYRNMVRPGGIILFDDISLNPSMANAWDLVLDPKVSLPKMHSSGFGAAVKDELVRPPSWEELKARVIR